MSFPDAVKGIEPGEQAALAALDRLRPLAVSEKEYQAWRATQHHPYKPPPVISFVDVKASGSATSEYVHDRITAKPGEPLDLDALDSDIRGAYGRGTYESITYRLRDDEGEGVGLEVTPVDAALGRILFRAGLQISDDFSGDDDYQLNMEARVTGLSEKGAEWRTLGGIGRVTTFATDLYFPFAERGNWFVSPEVSWVALNQPLVVDDITVAQYRVESWVGALRIGRDFDDRFRVSMGLVGGHDRAERAIADPAYPPSVSADIGGFNVTMLWDTLDNVRFPRRGMRAEVNYTNYQEDLGSDSDGNQWRIAIDKALSSGRNTVLIGGRASVSKENIDAYQTDSSLGGLTFLSGLGERELIDSQMLLVRSIFYRRLTQQGLLFDLPLYAAGSLEGGNVWSSYDDVSLNDLIGAGSVFLGIDLPIGPLQFGYGRTFDGRSSFYLTFGSLVLPRYR